MINNRALLFLIRAWRDRRGQDLIEYALMAGFVAVAAGVIMPTVSSSISTIFSQRRLRNDRGSQLTDAPQGNVRKHFVRTFGKVARTITV